MSGADRDLEALEQHGDLADELRDQVCRAAGGQGRRETSLEESPGESPAGDTPRRAEPHTPASRPAVAEAVVVIAEDVLPGWGRSSTRREALHAAVDYLREYGQATPHDFQTTVYPEHTGRYTAGDKARKLCD